VTELRETDKRLGRYPVWDKFESLDIMLGDLTFESDIKITVLNIDKGVFGGVKEFEIGEFALPFHSIKLR
jgi:hypothetical protein